MTMNEAEDLPCLAADEKFQFSCGPDQPCFNRCCSQLNLPLTPYDVVRLCANLEMGSSDFLPMFTGMRRNPETGLAEFHLRMVESPDAPCPFVSPAGCSVYADRPGACRQYPLGRGTRMEKEGIRERFFMIREEHCCGFEQGRSFTAKEWFADQELNKYNEFNDLYMRLLTMIRASGEPLPSRLAGMADLSLWQMDRFAELIRKTGLLAQLSGPLAERPNLLEDNLAGAEARLEFGMNWLELLVFGTSPGLQR